MATYNIDIVKDKKHFYILDFTLIRPLVGTEISEEKAIDFARGYKTGIEINSYNKYQPKIENIIVDTTDIKQYIRDKRKEYQAVWQNEK